MPSKLKTYVLALLVLVGTACSCVHGQINDWQDLGSSNSGYVQRKPTPIPQSLAAPSLLTATATGLTTVVLEWVNNAQYQHGQTIQRCAGSSCANFATIYTLTPAQAGWTDTSATAGTTYSYRVSAYFGSVNSQWSNTASLTMPTLPTAPSLFSATASGGFQIDLGWTDNADNEEAFEIERCTGLSCEDFVTVANTSADTEALSDTGLTANTVYCYRVRASNDYGASSYANEAGDQTVDVTPTPTPTPTATPPPACGDDETLTDAVAAWCLGEADTAVVDSVAAISLAPFGSPTFGVTAAAPWAEYSPGVGIASLQGFYISGVQAAMNVGTGSATISWVGTKDAVSAGTDVIFSQDSAYAKGVICYWYNASYERIKCEFHNSAVDYSTCTWNTATTNAIPGDNSNHLYDLLINRTAATVNLKIDGTTQSSGCSLSAIAGDSLTNTGFWLGMGDSIGTNAYRGNLYFWRQTDVVN